MIARFRYSVKISFFFKCAHSQPLFSFLSSYQILKGIEAWLKYLGIQLKNHSFLNVYIPSLFSLFFRLIKYLKGIESWLQDLGIQFKINSFLKCVYSRPFFLAVKRSRFKILPLGGFEPRISDIRSDRSANWATTTDQSNFY